MPRKKSLESRVQSALDKQLDNIDTLEPAVRMTAIKLGIQMMIVQNKISDSKDWGSAFSPDEESKDD